MNPNVIKRPFNKRAFISTALFTSGLCLPISGFMIHINQIEELTVARHFWMSLHDVSGILFLIFSIIHIAINWRSLNNYVRRAKDVLISKESLIAITLVIIIVGIVSSHPFHINN